MGSSPVVSVGECLGGKKLEICDIGGCVSRARWVRPRPVTFQPQYLCNLHYKALGLHLRPGAAALLFAFNPPPADTNANVGLLVPIAPPGPLRKPIIMTD